MLKRIILLAIIVIPMGALAQKFGHINPIPIMQAMPEYTKAQTELQELQKQYEGEMKLMQDELTRKDGEYTKQRDSLPENIRQRREAELADLYAGACAVVTASRWYEGFPLSVIEAMYYGAPVVVPALAGLPEIVADGTCGAIDPAGSATALADTLRRLVDHPDQAAALGQKGRERVQKFYNPDLYCRLLIENAEQITHSGTKSAV